MSTTDSTSFALAAADPYAEVQHLLATEEWLASLVLQHIDDVRAVCRLALVNKNFHTASRSDVVWQKRLPAMPVLDAVGAPSLGPRDLYLHLCKSVSYEGGLKKLWLDPASGGECYMISARGLSITWGDTPEHWRWKPCAGSMFREVAYLHEVCWFEIKGEFEQRLRPGRYMLSFRMQMNSTGGWWNSPVKLRIANTTYAHEPSLSQVLFDNAASFKRRHCPSPNSTSSTQTQTGSDDDKSTHESTDDQAQDVWMSPSQDADEQLNEDRGFEDYDNPSSSESVQSCGYESVSQDDNEAPPPEEVWIECDAGEFLVEDDNDDQPIKVQFSMRETDVLLWKGGFVLDGVIVRPYDVAMSRLIEQDSSN